jgi:hypothetical protein
MAGVIRETSDALQEQALDERLGLLPVLTGDWHEAQGPFVALDGL